MTLLEWQTHFSLWASVKATLILGNDVRSMPDEVRDSTVMRGLDRRWQSSAGSQDSLQQGNHRYQPR